MKYLVLLVCIVGSALAAPTGRPSEDRSEVDNESKGGNGIQKIDMDNMVNYMKSAARAKGLFASLDANGNGTVERQEYINANMAMDEDGDGYVDEKEYIRAVEEASRTVDDLLNLDADGDGKITIEELMKFAMSQGKPSTSPANAQAKRGEEEEDDEDEDEKEEKHESSVKDLNAEMAARNITGSLISFIMLDTNRDGLLSEKEINQAFTNQDTNQDGIMSEKEFMEDYGFIQGVALVFAKMDKNGDGKLDGREVLYAAIHKPEGEQEDSYDEEKEPQGERHGVRQGEIQGYEGLEKSQTGADVKRAPGEVDVAVAAAYNSLAEDILFETYDINGDGVIDKEEYVETFLATDSNRDGKLSRAEFVHSFRYLMESIDSFVEADTNQDGLVDIREFVPAAMKAMQGARVELDEGSPTDAPERRPTGATKSLEGLPTGAPKSREGLPTGAPKSREGTPTGAPKSREGPPADALEKALDLEEADLEQLKTILRRRRQ